MARCQYCGKPARPFRSHHQACHDRHQRATTLIPNFFTKVLDSPIPAERFSLLLRDAAQAAFIDDQQLGALCIAGTSELIATVLEQRLPTPAEEQRILEILSAIDPRLAADPGLEEIFAKIQILRELGDGKTPDLVEVGGTMPVKLRRGEPVLWIFNDAKAFRKPAGKEPAYGHDVHAADRTYLGLARFHRNLRAPRRFADDRIGDMMLTNFNLYFFPRSGKMMRIPVARILWVEPYANGVNVHYGPQDRSWAYLVPDPWFLTNALALLTWSVRRDGSAAATPLVAGPPPR
jgi:hypothetical protein